MPRVALTHHPIGILEIDAQHDGLADAIKSIQGDIAMGLAPERITNGLLELLKLARVHFATEEEHMLCRGYPAFAQHRAEHTSLVGQLRALCTGVAEGFLTVDGRVATELWLWFTDHAEKADRVYGRWLL